MKRFLLILFLAVSIAIAGCSSVPGGGSPEDGGESPSGDGESETSGDSPSGNKGLETSGDVVSSISVTAADGDLGEPVLQVNVEADAEAAPLRVTVSGPRDQSVVGARLSESDLLDGSETAEGRLADNPPGGEYTVFIQRVGYAADKEVVAEKSVSLERGQPVIEDVSASGTEADIGGGYLLTAAEVVVSNSGDIPLQISEIDVLSPSDDGFIPYTTSGKIGPGRTQTYATDEPYTLPRFSERRTTIEIVVRYGDGQQVSESITVTAG